MIVIMAGLVAVGLFVVSVASLMPGAPSAVVERLHEMETQYVDAREAELALPLSKRLMGSLTRSVGAKMARRSGPERIAAIEDRIAAAGGMGGLTGQELAARQVVFGVIGLVAGLWVGFLLQGMFLVLLPIVLGVIGYMFPALQINSKAGARRKIIVKLLPTVLDLLCVSVEAGQSFDRAVQNIIEKYDNPLSQELDKVMNSINLGHARREALRDMAARVGADDLSSFVQAIVQSEQMGTSLGQVLRVQSEEMRRKRRQRAAAAGAQAPVKMLLPMVCCIFPSIFIVLMGPAVLTISKSL